MMDWRSAPVSYSPEPRPQNTSSGIFQVKYANFISLKWHGSGKEIEILLRFLEKKVFCGMKTEGFERMAILYMDT